MVKQPATAQEVLRTKKEQMNIDDGREDAEGHRDAVAKARTQGSGGLEGEGKN